MTSSTNSTCTLTEESKHESKNNIQIYTHPPPLLNTPHTLSILSYNVLFKGWVTDTRYPNVKDEHRQWHSFRLPILRSTISSYNSDIICLQEMDIDIDPFQQDFGAHFSKLGYDYILPQKPVPKLPPNPQKKENWGNVTLFNSTKYKCIYQESLKKNPRVLIGLFIDLQTVANCHKCTENPNKYCVNHSFFIVNVHLTAHPQKHMQRLHEIRKLIQRLNTFGKTYEPNRQTKDPFYNNIAVNSNINGHTPQMRVIICGDFNSPKTGLCDQLLITKQMNYNSIRINNVSKQSLTDTKTTFADVKRRIRFIFNVKDIGQLIGKKGFFIAKLKNVSKANVIIPTMRGDNSNKIKTRLVIIIGQYLQVIKAISMIVNKVRRQSLVMCIDEANIKCLDFGAIYKIGWAKVRVSQQTLFNSTEKTIDISGNKKAMYTSTKIIVKQLFNSKSYVLTRMEYFPANVCRETNVFQHLFEFKDCYDMGLCQYLERSDIDPYYDRLQCFPTFSDGRICAAMDFIYFTANNMSLKGITKTVSDTKIMQTLSVEIAKNKKELNGKRQNKDMQMEQGINFENLWCLPNQKCASDHLPIFALFVMKDSCDKLKEKCDCCIEKNKVSKDGQQNEEKTENKTE